MDSFHPSKVFSLDAVLHENRRPRSRSAQSWFYESAGANDQGPKRSSAPRPKRLGKGFYRDEDDETNNRIGVRRIIGQAQILQGLLLQEHLPQKQAVKGWDFNSQDLKSVIYWGHHTLNLID